MQSRKFLFVLTLIAILLISMQPNAGLNSAQANDDGEDEYYFIRSWGGEEGNLFLPIDVEVGNNGTIYVVNNLSNFITMINPGERTFRTFGEYGDGEGQFDEPCGIGIDSLGNVYISDIYNHRIQKFSSEGNFLVEWGGYGSGNGQFRAPCGISVDKSDNIYVTDIWNHRIQKFSNDGTFITQWGSYGVSGDSKFQNPEDVAVDKKDEFAYVADTFNHRIQKFSLNGDFVSQWEVGVDERRDSPNGIVVGEDNHIFVSHTGGVTEFDSNGVRKASWGSGWFNNNKGIAMDANQKLLVADRVNQRVLKFDLSGTYITAYGNALDEDSEFESIKGMAVAGNKFVYIADYDNDRIKMFNIDGVYFSQWGEEGSGEGEFSSPYDVAVDLNGNVYVADTHNHRIQKFSSDGSFLNKWGSSGVESGEFTYPQGINVDIDGFVYVADTENSRIQKFNPSGEYITHWECYDPRFEKLIPPVSIDFDNDGNVYVAFYNLIQKYDQSGNFIFQWGDSGSEPGQPNSVRDILIFDETLFTIEWSSDRIQMFSLEGEFLGLLAGKGSSPGQVRYPTSIAISSQGEVFVGDSGNRRIQVFSTVLPTPDSYSGLIQNGNFEERKALTQWTYGGSLPISRSNHAIQGNYALQLGSSVPQEEQGEGQAWAHQTIYVDPAMTRPTLSFRYKMFVNDIIDYSDFFVAIQDGVGLNHLETVLRGGYRSKTAPTAGKNMGWRTHSFDLSAYKGQHIRVVFSNRNLWSNSWGIWTFVDDVRVVDVPEPDGPSFYLPMFMNSAKTSNSEDADNEFDLLLRPETP